ncbi:MAG: polysaccharide deacetylase family protein [Segetibacter sp.]
MSSRQVLLTFDLEEFDVPIEYGSNIGWEEQIAVGREGMENLLEVLNHHGVPTTIFTTAAYALENKSQIQYLAERHEIASHTFYHCSFKVEHLLLSRTALEDICGKPLTGLRMPRMRQVEMQDVKAAGYQYDSSINPTLLPGHYNNLHLPRTIFTDKNVIRLPASVTAYYRIPLFWLSFKNLPYHLFLYWVKQTLRNDGYVCLYFHPWEFADISRFKVPWYIKRHSGNEMAIRLKRLITDLKKEGSFETIYNFLRQRNLD